MTAVSTSSAALAILSQAGSVPAEKTGSAVDTILDIVSGRNAKDAATPAARPREAGGTVSSEISKATTSARSAIVVNHLQSMDYPPDMKPPEANVENAEGLVRMMTYWLEQYNHGFDADKVAVSREDYNANIDKWAAYNIANGRDADLVNQRSVYDKSDEGYTKYKNSVDSDNLWRHNFAARGKETFAVQQDIFSSIFGFDITASYSEDGRATMDSFDLYYATGQKMLSIGEDGSLTSYYKDGTVRSNDAKKDVARS